MEKLSAALKATVVTVRIGYGTGSQACINNVPSAVADFGAAPSASDSSVQTSRC